MQWQSCPQEPLGWFAWREPLLTLLFTPALSLPLAGAVALLLVWWLRPSRPTSLAVALLLPLVLSAS